MHDTKAQGTRHKAQGTGHKAQGTRLSGGGRAGRHNYMQLPHHTIPYHTTPYHTSRPTATHPSEVLVVREESPFF